MTSIGPGSDGEPRRVVIVAGADAEPHAAACATRLRERSVAVVREDGDGAGTAHALLLIASVGLTESTSSTAVADDWMAEHGTSAVVLVLASGELHWDASIGRFDDSTTALAAALRQRFRQRPLWLDARRKPPGEVADFVAAHIAAEPTRVDSPPRVVPPVEAAYPVAAAAGVAPVAVAAPAAMPGAPMERESVSPGARPRAGCVGATMLTTLVGAVVLVAVVIGLVAVFARSGTSNRAAPADAPSPGFADSVTEDSPATVTSRSTTSTRGPLAPAPPLSTTTQLASSTSASPPFSTPAPSASRPASTSTTPTSATTASEQDRATGSLGAASPGSPVVLIGMFFLVLVIGLGGVLTIRRRRVQREVGFETPQPAPMPAGNHVDAFLSHERGHEGQLADRLASSLSPHMSVWVAPANIPPGADFVAAINDALTRSRNVVVLASVHAMASDWVMGEINAAIARKFNHQIDKLILVRVDDCEVPPLLSTSQVLWLRDGYDRVAAGLIEAVNPEGTEDSGALLSTP